MYQPRPRQSVTAITEKSASRSSLNQPIGSSITRSDSSTALMSPCSLYIQPHMTPTTETEVTTADLEQRLAPLYRRFGVAPGFLEAITGIRARRFWDPGVQPSDVATLVWLGGVYLEQDRPDAAEPLFTKALSLQPRSVAASFGRASGIRRRRSSRSAREG